MRKEYFRAYWVSGVLMVLALGCEMPGHTSWMPNKDPALRHKPVEWAADAAKRHPYPANAPRGGEANGRIQVGYWINNLDIANLSNGDWDNVDLWVNQTYVVHIPKIPARQLRTINFEMMYDDAGHHFPLDNSKTLVNKAEVYMDGKLFDVPVRLAE